MDTSLLILIITQVILLSIIFTVVYIFIMNRISIDLNKRFENYSLTSIKDDSIPFFDRMYAFIWKIIKSISKFLDKSELLRNYGKKYNKYISYNELEIKSGIDYVSIKFIVSFILGLTYLISTFIRIKYNNMFLLLILFGSFFLMDVYYSINYKRKRKRIENDLLSAIIVMNNAFKSGMNILQAVQIVEQELTGPIQEEFKKISLDIKYGLSLETVFNRFYKRVKIDDIKYLTSSLSLINKTGGNIIKVFESIEKNFYDKMKIKEEMNSLTSSSLFMFRLLLIMPILLIIVVLVLNPAYFLPLIETAIGKVIIATIIILYILYVIVIRKVLKVDV